MHKKLNTVRGGHTKYAVKKNAHKGNIQDLRVKPKSNKQATKKKKKKDEYIFKKSFFINLFGLELKNTQK